MQAASIHTGFLSTLSLRRATGNINGGVKLKGISIHALLAESDLHIRSTLPGHPDISIHALLAESDPGKRQSIPRGRDFYPRSPCGERLQPQFPAHQIKIISIHALLAESDS